MKALSAGDSVARALIKAVVAHPSITSADLAAIVPLIGPDYYFDLVLNHPLVDCAVLCAMVKRCDSRRRGEAVFSRARQLAESLDVVFFSLAQPDSSGHVRELAVREIPEMASSPQRAVNKAKHTPGTSTLEVCDILRACEDGFCGLHIGRFLRSIHSVSERELLASARWSVDDVELLSFAEHPSVTPVTYGDFALYARSEITVQLMWERAGRKGSDPKMVLLAALRSPNPAIAAFCTSRLSMA